MITVNRHLGLKLVALILVITIFTTLIPRHMVFWAEENDAPQTDFPASGYEFLNISDPDSGTEQINRASFFDEYEQIALEELGNPSTVEDVDPYRHSDVTYELRNMQRRRTLLPGHDYSRALCDNLFPIRVSWRIQC